MSTQDIVLYVSLAILGTVAIFEYLRLGWESRELKRRIQALPDRASNGSLSEEQDSESNLERAWTRYQKTFAGPKNKTEEEAELHFTEDAVIGGALNLRYWRAVPNLLVGIGILGTFIGLTFGIAGFDAQTVESVRASIETLLSGISTAFVSSIAGMGFSIVFSWYEKKKVYELNQARAGLCAELDERYLISESERHSQKKKRRREAVASALEEVVEPMLSAHHKTLREMLSYESDDGTEIHTSHVLRDLHTEAEKQTRTLKSFSTEVADGIKMSSMTIESLSSELDEVFQSAIEKNLAPTMGDVEQAVEELRDEKAASNEEMVESVVDNLSETLNDISGQFQESLTGGAIDQLEQTAATVAEMGELLDSFESDFASMSENLQDSVEAMAERAGEEAQKATANMRKETEEVTKQMQQRMDEMIQSIESQSTNAAEAFSSEVEEVTDSMSEEIKSLQTTSASLLSRQQKSAELVQELLGEGTEVAGKLDQTATSFSHTLNQLNEVVQTLDQATGQAENAGEALEASTTQLREHQEEWLNAERESISKLQDNIEDLDGLSQKYAHQFETIRDGLEEIFGEIEEGLSEYQNVTRESINTYIGDFNENLREATQHMNGTVGALQESFNELHEILDRMKGMANGQQ